MMRVNGAQNPEANTTACRAVPCRAGARTKHTALSRTQPQRPRRRWSLKRQSGLRFRLAPVRVPHSRAGVWHGGDMKKAVSPL